MRGVLSLLSFATACLLTLFHDQTPVSYSNFSEGQQESDGGIIFTHNFVRVDHTLLESPTNVTFHYVASGNPLHPVVVFLHGFPDSWVVWKQTMSAVTKEGYYALSFDLKGFGQTSKPLSQTLYPENSGFGGNYTFAFAADEIVAALDAVKVTQFHLITHDLGSWIGKALAGRWSSRIMSYVVSQTSVAVQSYAEVPQFAWVRKFPHFFIKFLEPRSELLLRSLYGGVRSGEWPISHKRAALDIPHDLIQRAVHDFTPNSIRSWISYHCDIGIAYYHFKRELAYFQKYNFPTLILQGGLDPAQPRYYFDGTAVLTCGNTIWPFTPSFPFGIGCVVNPIEEKDSLWRFSKPLLYQEGYKPAHIYFPSAQLKILPHVGHFAHIEDANTVSTIILEFLTNGKIGHATYPIGKENKANAAHDEL